MEISKSSKELESHCGMDIDCVKEDITDFEPGEGERPEW